MSVILTVKSFGSTYKPESSVLVGITNSFENGIVITCLPSVPSATLTSPTKLSLLVGADPEICANFGGTVSAKFTMWTQIPKVISVLLVHSLTPSYLSFIFDEFIALSDGAG